MSIIKKKKFMQIVQSLSKTPKKKVFHIKYLSKKNKTRNFNDWLKKEEKKEIINL